MPYTAIFLLLEQTISSSQYANIIGAAARVNPTTRAIRRTKIKTFGEGNFCIRFLRGLIMSLGWRLNNLMRIIVIVRGTCKTRGSCTRCLTHTDCQYVCSNRPFILYLTFVWSHILQNTGVHVHKRFCNIHYLLKLKFRTGNVYFFRIYRYRETKKKSLSSK